MADEDTETREPDATEEASDANAGQATEPRATVAAESAAVATEGVAKPDFDRLNEAISETRKQAGPDFLDVSPEESLRELDDSDDDTEPTDPS